jgi:hypothetical protein
MFGNSKAFPPSSNPPQATILAAGAAEQRVFGKGDGAPAIATLMA